MYSADVQAEASSIYPHCVGCWTVKQGVLCAAQPGVVAHRARCVLYSQARSLSLLHRQADWRAGVTQPARCM
jgi:hypothetical protein